MTVHCTIWHHSEKWDEISHGHNLSGPWNHLRVEPLALWSLDSPAGWFASFPVPGISCRLCLVPWLTCGLGHFCSGPLTHLWIGSFLLWSLDSPGGWAACGEACGGGTGVAGGKGVPLHPHFARAAGRFPEPGGHMSLVAFSLIKENRPGSISANNFKGAWFMNTLYHNSNPKCWLFLKIYL
jgi:hypothetical protein